MSAVSASPGTGAYTASKKFHSEERGEAVRRLHVKQAHPGTLLFTNSMIRRAD